MEDRQKLIEEIKRLEQELYLRRSKLGSADAMQYGVTRPSLLARGTDVEEWKKVIQELICLIGLHSQGGDSVKDVQNERTR